MPKSATLLSPKWSMRSRETGLLKSRIEDNRRHLREHGYVVGWGTWSPHINGWAERRQGQAPARRRPAHRARAHRPAGRQGLLPRDRRDRRQGRVRRERPGRSHAGQLRDGARQDRRPPRRRVSGDDFTVRGGSADAIKDASRQHHPSGWPTSIAPAAHPHDRRLGRRRLGQDHRDHRARQPAGRRRLGMATSATTWASCRRRRWASGSVAGLGAARLAASHYSVMTKDSRRCSSPARRWWPALGQKLDQAGARRLGDPVRAGAVDDAVDTEEEAFARAPLPVSYLPSSVYELPPRGERRRSGATAARRCCSTAVPRDRRKVYKMRPIIEPVVDQGSFFEMGQMFGRSIITGLARLDGLAGGADGQRSLFYGGAWTADACPKVVRFVDLAETFHLPVVYLVRLPGLPDRARGREERRPSARACAPWPPSTRRRVPWCTVIISQRVRRRRRRPPAGTALHDPLRLAVGPLGLAAARGRHRGRLPRRDRRRRRPEAKPGRDRGAAQQAALAVPHGRDVLDRGDHRPARRCTAHRRRRTPAGRSAAPSATIRHRTPAFTRRADGRQNPAEHEVGALRSEPLREAAVSGTVAIQSSP